LCSNLVLNSLLLDKTDSESDFFGDFFLNIGTVVHSVLQKHSKNALKLWGNWKCSRCGTTWKHSTRNKCNCGGDADYVEVEVDYLGVKGHIDLIYITDDGVVITDFKTTTSGKIIKNTTYDSYPQNYLYQIASYFYMCEKLFAHKFKRYGGLAYATLFFISRDNPSSNIEFDFSRKQLIKLGKETILNARTAYKYAKKAFNNLNVDTFNECKEVRMCSNLDDYLQSKSKLFYGGCQLFNECVNSKSNIKLLHYFKGLKNETR
jgi:hypothetical protein